MADIVHPEAKYKIAQVGPSRPFDFADKKDPSKKIEMIGYDVQFEGIADWVKVNQMAATAAPQIGDELEGHIEDTGKFGLKFAKKRAGGSWGGGYGGGAATPGAQWSAAFETAAHILIGYGGAKSKTIKEYMVKVEDVAKMVKDRVDTLAKEEAPKADTIATKSESESGESPSAPAPTAPANGVEIEEVTENDVNW